MASTYTEDYSGSSSGRPGSCGSSRKASLSFPTHCLSKADLASEAGRFSYGHFHAPHNSNSRFMASLTQSERSYLREYVRMPPYTTKPCASTSASSTRPQTAPSPRQHGTAVAHGELRVGTGARDKQTTMLRTSTGSPCFNRSRIVTADIVLGQPACGEDGKQWSKARVLAYATAPSAYGYGTCGKRAAHQDYKHYKYYGFAGQGAKTSWGRNPKGSRGDNFLQL